MVIPLFISFCGLTKNNDQKETPTSGSLTILSDHGLKLIMENQSYTFQKLYANSKISSEYVTESEAINALFKDSAKVIVINRPLSEKEKNTFNQNNIYPQVLAIAESGIVLISSFESTDSIISMEELKDKLKNKSILGKNSKQQSNDLVFDKNCNGLTFYFKDSLNEGKNLDSNCFALAGTKELIEYVISHPGSIGVIDYAMISDRDDERCLQILKKVRVLGVSSSKEGKAFLPDQSNIKTGDYSLKRRVWMIKRSAEFSLGAGFMAFVAGQKGQRMMMKQGMVATFEPGREVEVNLKPLGQ